MLDVLLNWNQNLVDFFTHSIIMVIAFTWVTAVAIYHYSNTEKVPFFKGNLLSFLHGFKAVGSYFLGLMLLLNFGAFFYYLDLIIPASFLTWKLVVGLIMAAGVTWNYFIYRSSIDKPINKGQELVCSFVVLVSLAISCYLFSKITHDYFLALPILLGFGIIVKIVWEVYSHKEKNPTLAPNQTEP